MPAIAKLLAVACTAVLTVAAGPRADDPPPSIMAIMHKEFTVKRAPIKTVKRELAAEAPDWEAVTTATETLVTLAEALTRNVPRRGECGSWKRLTTLHLNDVKAMRDGARKQDLDAVGAAYQRVVDSCTTCHEAHKYQRED